jgi:hypothetical protein
VAHWRALFTSNEFLTSADLYNESTDTFSEITVEIERVVGVTLKGEGGREDGRPGIYFRGSRTGKPLGANATNCTAIESIAGSNDFKKWLGVWITLFVGETDIRKGRGKTERRPCLRVKPEKPSAELIAAATKRREERAKEGRRG